MSNKPQNGKVIHGGQVFERNGKKTRPQKQSQQQQQQFSQQEYFQQMPQQYMPQQYMLQQYMPQQYSPQLPFMQYAPQQYPHQASFAQYTPQHQEYVQKQHVQKRHVQIQHVKQDTPQNQKSFREIILSSIDDEKHEEYAKQEDFFTSFSYFEFEVPERGFVGLFKGERARKPLTPFQVGDHLFTCAWNPKVEKNFRDFCCYLLTYKHAFPEWLGYLFPPKVMIVDGKQVFLSASRGNYAENFHPRSDIIVHWLHSLFVCEVHDEQCYQVLKIGSTLRADFSVELYASDAPLPMSVHDTSFFCVQKPKGKAIANDPSSVSKAIAKNEIQIYTSLGQKKYSGKMPVFLKTGEEIMLLTASYHGALCAAGEHTDPEEIQMAKDTLHENGDAIRKGIAQPLTNKSSFASRGLLEEHGIDLRDVEYTCWFYGISDEPGRDHRYWENDFVGKKYGYKRFGACLLFATVIMINSEHEIPQIQDPLDADECSQAKLITLPALMNGFKIGGRFDPAFPIHVKQLALSYAFLCESLAKHLF